MALRIKDDDDVRELHAMYQSMSLEELSLETGIGVATIRRHFDRLGLPVRPKSSPVPGKPQRPRPSASAQPKGTEARMPRAVSGVRRRGHRRRGRAY